MTFKDIKNISDEEFINILRKYIPEEIFGQIYNNKLSKYNKKAYIASILTIGSLLGIIGIETLEALIKEGVSLELTSYILLSSMILSYMVVSKIKNKEFNSRKDKFNDEIMQIKTMICNLSEEEFNKLVSSYEYIIDNNLDSNINLNILEVINKLLSINAIHILQEFEIENNESKLSIYYEEMIFDNDTKKFIDSLEVAYNDEKEDLGYSKNISKNN